MKILWFFPTGGDERYLGITAGRRTVTIDYFSQLARAYDSLGYYGALLPTGTGCEDAWVLASALSSITSKLRFLIALRPGAMTPSQAARMSATFDRLTNGRLLINVVTGSGKETLAADGIPYKYDDRYPITDEFLTIWRGLLREGSITFEGEHLSLIAGSNEYPPIQKPYPPIWFGGSSDAGIRVGAKHADVYLTWGEPVDMVAEKLTRVKREAVALGRKITFGIRLHVIVRRTEEMAWDAANELIHFVTDDAIRKAQEMMSKRDSEGQRRMMSLQRGDRGHLSVGPNLWSGIGLLRPGVGTALVGSPENVAQRMREYEALGIDTFILSGYPHLEEAYRFAELVFPLFSDRLETT